MSLVRAALILGLLSAVGPFAIDMYLPALPAIEADLSTDVAAVQYTLIAYFVAFGVSQLFLRSVGRSGGAQDTALHRSGDFRGRRHLVRAGT